MTKVDSLIAKICPNGVEFKRFDEIAAIIRGVLLVRSQLAEVGRYPVNQNSMKPPDLLTRVQIPAEASLLLQCKLSIEQSYFCIFYYFE
jgi:hypothetical protein